MNRKTVINRSMGFTIVELMITIVVAAILMTVAVPSFNDLIKTNRVRTQISSVMAMLQTARSEAVKRGQTVAICALDGGAPRSCTGNWGNALTIFFDTDDDGRLDAAEAVIKVSDGLSGNNTFNWNGGLNRIRYDARGGSTTAGTLKLCDSGNVDRYARAIIIAFPTGLTRLSSDSNGDGIHDGVGGANLSCP